MRGATAQRRVVMGRIGAPFGVRGWVKVQPFTGSPDALLQHRSWQVGTGAAWIQRELSEARVQGGNLVVRFQGVEDRDTARALTGAQVAVWRSELPQAQEGEFYHCDLEGLCVVTVDGLVLGEVERVMETGANDVLVVCGERERLIPLLWDTVVTGVDLEAGRLQVDWDPDF